jgi:hypothetical protein
MSSILSRDEVKLIFTDAVLMVADIADPQDPGFENNTYNHFEEFHKVVFLNKLKEGLNNKRFTYQGSEFCYDIPLNENMFNTWNNFKGCIEYVTQNQQSMPVKNKVTDFS